MLQDVEELTRESGSKAAFDLGIHDMDEQLLESLGKLRFHTQSFMVKIYWHIAQRQTISLERWQKLWILMSR